MATRKAVAASIASAVIFSSLLISNFALYSGETQSFRSVSLAAEERAYYDQALVVRSVALLDLLDGAQDLLSSGLFTCANSSYSVGQLLSAERVHLGWSGVSAQARLLPAPDETLADNLTSLHPFNGSTAGWVNLRALAIVQGRSPDASVSYNRSEWHLLNLPLRLSLLTAHCLTAYAKLSSELGSLGTRLCNASVLADAVSPLAAAVSASARSDGLSVTVSYAITSTQPCRVGFGVLAYQENIAGPEGAFRFSEAESGLATG